MQSTLQRLHATITYAKRFATHDRVVIRQGYEWVVIGPHVEQLIQHADVDAHRAHLRVMRRIIKFSTKRHQALQVRYLASLWPVHHQGWLCIHHSEGGWADPNSGGNGHYGGLQMTPGWLGYIPHGDTANHYSQWQQETWAEQGYRDSGYSSTWLQGQWGQTIGPCWGYFN